MSPKNKISKEKWREYAQKRRERIKNDPALALLEAEKERKKYAKKKALKQVKSVNDMSDRELRKQRKKWRVASKKAYEKKKNNARFEQFLDAESPPDSEPERGPNNEQIVQPPVDGRTSSGRKKVKKGRAKSDRLLVKEREKSKCLEREKNKWKQKFYRLKMKTKETRSDKFSPRKVVAEVMKRGHKQEIRRKLLFGEAVKLHFKEKYKKLSSKKEKRAFGRVVAGNADILKRYNLLSDLKITLSNKLFRNVRMMTNNTQLKQRVRKINDMVKTDLRLFYEDDEVSMLCPGKKDCVTRKGIKKQKRVLTDSLKNLHAKFLLIVDYKISYVSFCKLKPFWVVAHKVSERDTCLCKTHANIEMFSTALNKAHIIDNSNAKNFAHHICCDINSVDCLQRQCEKCKNLNIPYLVFEENDMITYDKWQTKSDTFIGKNKKPQTVKHIVKDKVTLTAMEAVDAFEADYKKFLYHEGNVIHQFRSIKNLKTRLSDEEALIHCDYSENYCMKYSSEIQAFHFGGSRQQYTLHTSQIYFKKDSYSNVTSQSMCTLSECLDHGPAAVWAHLQPILEFIKRTVPKVRIIHFLTDSPATQYRNKTIFYLIAHALEHSMEFSIATWNYMEAGHGKGAPDGVGGCLKRTADKMVARGGDISSFRRFVEVLRENTRNINISLVDTEEIEAMKKVLPPSIPPFPGTMKVHQAVYVKEQPNKLTMRRLSCFDCYNCERYLIGVHEIPKTEPEEQHLLEDVDCEVRPDSPQEPKDQPTCALPAHYDQPSTSTGLTTALLRPGDYIVVRFKSSSKRNNKSGFCYVCCIEKINDDNTLIVNGLRSFQKTTTQFVMQDNDTCVIDQEDILRVLPEPKFLFKNRKMIFSFPCDIEVREQ